MALDELLLRSSKLSELNALMKGGLVAWVDGAGGGHGDRGVAVVEMEEAEEGCPLKVRLQLVLCLANDDGGSVGPWLLHRAMLSSDSRVTGAARTQ